MKLEAVERRVLEKFWRLAEVGCCLVSEEGKFMAANQKLCELLEYSPIELEALTYQDITHPSDVMATVAMKDQVARGELSHFRMTKTYLKKSGYPVQIDLVVWPIKKEDGSFEFFLNQIVPKVNVHSGKRRASDCQDVRVDSSIVITSFLRDNKKLLGALTALLGAVAAALSAVAHKLMSGI